MLGRAVHIAELVEGQVLCHGRGRKGWVLSLPSIVLGGAVHIAELVEGQVLCHSPLMGGGGRGGS